MNKTGRKLQRKRLCGRKEKKKEKEKGNQQAKIEAFVNHEEKTYQRLKGCKKKKVLYRKGVFCSSQPFTLTAFLNFIGICRLSYPLIQNHVLLFSPCLYNGRAALSQIFVHLYFNSNLLISYTVEGMQLSGVYIFRAPGRLNFVKWLLIFVVSQSWTCCMSLFCRLAPRFGELCTPVHYRCCFHESHFSCVSVAEILTVTIFVICRPTSKLFRLIELVRDVYKVHTPTNALFTKLDKVLKFTLKNYVGLLLRFYLSQ